MSYLYLFSVGEAFKIIPNELNTLKLRFDSIVKC